MSSETASPSKPRTHFNWADPFLLDQQLRDDERMIRETARAYCQDRLAPRVLDMFRHETSDASIFRELGELDMLGIVIPEEYGGAGLGYVSYGLVAREVERAEAQAVAWSGSGIRAEEVRIGQSCVVIVSRGNSGPSDHVAAVPCGR